MTDLLPAIVAIGGRTTEGVNADIFTRYTYLLQELIRDAIPGLPESGIGFLEPRYVAAGLTGPTIAGNYVASGTGFGLKDYTLKELPTEGLITFPAHTCTAVRVWRTKVDGSGTIDVNGHTVDCDSASSTLETDYEDIALGSSASRAVAVSYGTTGGGPTFPDPDFGGVQVFNGEEPNVSFPNGRGIHVINGGHSQYFASSFAAIPQQLTDQVGNANATAVVIGIGFNDFAIGFTKAAFKANVQTMISAVRAASSTVPIFLIKWYDEVRTSPLGLPWSDFTDALDELAAGAFIDTIDFTDWPDPVAGDGTGNYLPDGTHLSTAGHEDAADRIYAALNSAGIFAGSSTAMKTVIFYGDSLTEGIGATVSTRWTYLVQELARTANPLGFTQGFGWMEPWATISGGPTSSGNATVAFRGFGLRSKILAAAVGSLAGKLTWNIPSDSLSEIMRIQYTTIGQAGTFSVSIDGEPPITIFPDNGTWYYKVGFRQFLLGDPGAHVVELNHVSTGTGFAPHPRVGGIDLFVDEAPTGYALLDKTGQYEQVVTPYRTAFHPNDSLSARIDWDADDWTPGAEEVLVSIYDNFSGNYRVFRFSVQANGTLRLAFSGDGSSATLVDSLDPDLTGRWELGFTLDLDDGASGHVVKFWKTQDSQGQDPGGSAWTEIGTSGGSTRSGVKTIFAPPVGHQPKLTLGAISLSIFPLPASGKLYAFDLIVDGVKVADLNIEATCSLGSDNTGNIWVFNSGGAYYPSSASLVIVDSDGFHIYNSGKQDGLIGSWALNTTTITSMVSQTGAKTVILEFGHEDHTAGTTAASFRASFDLIIDAIVEAYADAIIVIFVPWPPAGAGSLWSQYLTEIYSIGLASNIVLADFTVSAAPTLALSGGTYPTEGDHALIAAYLKDILVPSEEITWDVLVDRSYELGVDRGVLNIPGMYTGPWNGLISVKETEVADSIVYSQLDGVTYANLMFGGFYQAAVSAFNYPIEAISIFGLKAINTGIYLTGQPIREFDLAYRTMVNENDYKIHIVYNAVASAKKSSHSTLSEKPDPDIFEWDISALPPVINGYKRSSHVVVDSIRADPSKLTELEERLYGVGGIDPDFPTQQEVLDIFGL